MVKHILFRKAVKKKFKNEFDVEDGKNKKCKFIQN